MLSGVELDVRRFHSVDSGHTRLTIYLVVAGIADCSVDSLSLLFPAVQLAIHFLASVAVSVNSALRVPVHRSVLAIEILDLAQ
jgi:hypothetical protein